MKLHQQVKKRFNEKYKQGHTPWAWSDVSPQIKQFAKRVKKDYQNPKLLDLGCGDGWLSIWFANQGFSVTGIDSSEIAIRKAREKAKQENLNIEFTVGDALDLTDDPNSFDAVFDRGLFHHLPKKEWQTYIDQVTSVLKDNGFFYLIVFSDKSARAKDTNEKLWIKRKDDTGYWTYDHFFTEEMVEDIFGNHFTIVKTDEDKEPQPGGSLTRYITMRKKKSTSNSSNQ